MTVWIDVTDLMVWRGHMTGIQRVVINLAVRVQRDYENTKCFYYDPRAKKFYEYDVNLHDWHEAHQKTPEVNSVSIRERIKSKMPYSLRRLVPRKIKHIAVKTGSIAIDKKRAFAARRTSAKQNNEQEAVFAPGDTVLVLGNAWDNEYLLQDLGLLRREQQFKIVNVIYDLIPILEPQYFGGHVIKQYTNYVFEAVTNCDLLLPISRSTEHDVRRFCEIIDAPAPKMQVMRLGDGVTGDEISLQPSWLKQTSAYVLCVGTIEVRKNHTLLYYAYKNLISKGYDVPTLIIVGKKGWYTSDIIMLFEQDPRMRSKVIIAENVSDQELVWLYQNCLFTIYPSLYEGWGLPVSESLSRGKVVLCSNTSSIPEAGGKLAEYFSPYDPVTCAELIEQYSSSKKLMTREKQIKKEYKVATWEDCYKTIRQSITRL